MSKRRHRNKMIIAPGRSRVSLKFSFAVIKGRLTGSNYGCGKLSGKSHRPIGARRDRHPDLLSDSTESDHFMTVKRGDIYYADLSPVVGSEQGGVRPVLIVQNDVGNRYSPTVIAAAITSQRDKSKLPTHIEIDSQTCGLSKDSIVLLEQIRTIDKKRLKEKMGRLDDGSMGAVDNALSISFGLGDASGRGART